MNELIKKLFAKYWHGELKNGPIEEQRQQLHKNLSDQVAGYWSGSSAYAIMVKGGFLVDSKRVPIEGTDMAEGKKLTPLGQRFMDSMANNG